jgi:peroxiredoxin
MFKANAYLISIKSPTFNAVTELNKIDSIFKDYDNPFFQDYKTYTFAAFLQISNNQKTRSISNNYYLNNRILYKNKSYMELFNQVYDKYLDYFGRTEKGEKIFSDIGILNSITALKSTLGNDEILKNDTLKELVILKCLHDEFYDDKISRSALLIVLDSLAQQTDLNEHRLIAQNIRKKVTRLMVGFEPPYFELLDKDSNLITLKNYKGKYVYLGFCVSLSYTCIQEFEMLRKLYERQNQNFEIVIISMDDNLAQMKNFIEKKNYPFTFLFYGNQPDIFKEFDIRTVPTYFFIDKNGKLALSPAATPGENIEYYIFNVMRKNGDI